MRIMLFNRIESSLSQIQYAIGLRIAFLLGDHVVYSGRPHHAWAILHYGPGMQPLEKIALMRDNEVADGQQLNELEEELYLTEYAPATERRLDALEKIDLLFNAVCDGVRRSIQREGYFSVEELFTTKNVFQVLSLADDIEEETDAHYPYSKWLLLQSYDEDEADINMLTAELFTHPLIRDKWVGIHHPSAKDLTKTYLHKCFTFPHLPALTIQQMQAIKDDLHDSIANFKEKLDKWCNLFWMQDFEDENIDHFKKDMLPAIEQLQQGFSQHAILQRYKPATLPENQIEVYMGEVPVKHIWQFLKDHGIIPGNTWQKLQEAITEDERLEFRWPVMIVRSNGAMLQSIAETGIEKSWTWKKEEAHSDNG